MRTAITAVAITSLTAGAFLTTSSVAAPRHSARSHHKHHVPALDPADIVPGRTITISGSGDIMVHTQIMDQAAQDASGNRRFDFRPQLAGLERLISSADLAICNIEFPMASTQGPFSAYPQVAYSPPQIALAAKAVGFDSCSTASNHTLDDGMLGVRTTIAAVEAAGLAHTGAYAHEADASVPTIIDVKGVKVAHLAYAYGQNAGMPNEWCVNIDDPRHIIRDARRAREAGARIVVVSLHEGEEDVIEPTDTQRSIVAKLAASSAIDLVIGHHAHVVQPIEKIGSMWVAYGHGNLLSAMERVPNPRQGEGLVTMFTFREGQLGNFKVIKAEGYDAYNDVWPFREHVVEKNDSAGYEASFQRMSDTVLSLGAYKDGFRMRRWG